MLSLAAFTMGELQAALQLLIVAEGEGVSDVRVIRASIDQHLTAERGKIRSAAKKAAIPPWGPVSKAAQRPQLCPQCGVRAVAEFTVDGARIRACKSCRWSEYLGEVG